VTSSAKGKENEIKAELTGLNKPGHQIDKQPGYNPGTKIINSNLLLR